MNGSDSHYQPSPDLPTPQSEGLNPLLSGQVPEQPLQAELASKQAELPPIDTPTANPLAPAAQTPFAPPPLPPVNPIAPVSTHIPVSDAPITANDNDLIEKEWVNKAKYIVNSSREDPRLQNKEMSKLKADYIQKRYNKQLKVSED